MISETLLLSLLRQQKRFKGKIGRSVSFTRYIPCWRRSKYFFSAYRVGSPTVYWKLNSVSVVEAGPKR